MRLICLAAACALATACASNIGYQARGEDSRYGYAEVQIEPNRMLISYRGDSATPRETVEMYLLYRAAETTLEHGYDHFVVAGHDANEQSRFEQTGVGPWFGSSYREISNHNAAIDIVMGRGDRPASRANAYDARAVRDSLRTRVTAPQQH